ncbi:ATP-binding protein [Comamonas sp. NoAH]|uniref:PAS domain-containing hybrid sensor histidine kinase/response regulator n=1 Tax=Comamonas halotolerans TaxID=3041496 RepID=UPI0024E133AC|nr:ATP-binding protein [Comamonas sp. NoAH]
MRRPDLSFLINREIAPTSPELLPDLQTDEQGILPPWDLPEDIPNDDPLAALIAELRNYQNELEIQNKVLDYSQVVAESASERFEALFSSVPLPLLVLDEHDMVIQANAMAHSAFQDEGRDRLLVSFLPYVCPSDTERVSQAFDAARLAGRSEAQEVIFTLGNGQQIQGDLHIACIQIPQREGPPIAQFMCALVDQGPLIAERHQLRERNDQLLASEQRLESVINSSLDAIICVDQEQRITVFNPTAATLFLCSATDALGSKLERFLPDAVHALDLAPITKQAMLGEMTARTATGKKLPVEVSMSFERLPDGEVTTVFARDLTRHKRAEAQRNELELQLRESHKMQALGTMAGGIAHDFNNIVGAILGNVELAKADCCHNTQALESLREIEKAGRRARDLVRQILTFSRNEPPKRYAVHAREVMHDTERLLRVTLPPAIELQVHAPQDLPCMLADPTQVEQALFNLITNAVHALGENRGLISMEATLSSSEQRLCDRLNLMVGDYVVISVQDNGPGIPPEIQQRIFEPFFTTKPVGQGTGLGLAVVHGVMRTHGGAVDVVSRLGTGSRFTLYFPVAASTMSSERTPGLPPSGMVPALPSASAAPKPDAAKHVMYVDDDQALVSLVQRLLRRRGYQVTGFLDPREATEALRLNPHAYDLVITDYNMPGYCGVDLVRDSKSIRPDLPVALASGYITAEIEAQALAAGATALIYKPNDVDELCETVDRLIHPNF